MKLVSLLSRVRNFGLTNPIAIKVGAFLSLKTFGILARKFPFLHRFVNGKLEDFKGKVTEVQGKLDTEVAGR
jgi:hypothetical protein